VRLPRDVSGEQLAGLLSRYGYRVTRQTGSHLRLTVQQRGGSYHITIPRHSSLRAGTLAAILREVSTQLELERRRLVEELFDRH